MTGAQHLTLALDLADAARTIEAQDEPVEKVLALYLEALVEILTALTLATVHPHLNQAGRGDWNSVAAPS